MEKVVASHADHPPHGYTHGLKNMHLGLGLYQRTYRAGHSTETSLDNQTWLALDQGDGVVMIILGLSTVFDTIDHRTLLERLESRIGIEGEAVSEWLSKWRHPLHYIYWLWPVTFVADLEHIIQIQPVGLHHLTSENTFLRKDPSLIANFLFVIGFPLTS